MLQATQSNELRTLEEENYVRFKQEDFDNNADGNEQTRDHYWG
jgi:hypothetical protein